MHQKLIIIKVDVVKEDYSTHALEVVLMVVNPLIDKLK